MNNIQETPSKKTRGGARKGAGCPRTIAKQITIGIRQDALVIFQQQPNKNAFITAAIRHYAAFLAEGKGQAYFTFQTKMRNSVFSHKNDTIY